MHKYNLSSHFRVRVVSCFYRQLLRFTLKTLHTCLYARGSEKKHPRADECRVLSQFYLLIANEQRTHLLGLNSSSLAEFNKRQNAERNKVCATISSSSIDECKKYALLAPKTEAAALVKLYPQLQSKLHSASSRVSFNEINKEFIKLLKTDLGTYGNVSADLILETVDILILKNDPTSHWATPGMRDRLITHFKLVLSKIEFREMRASAGIEMNDHGWDVTVSYTNNLDKLAQLVLYLRSRLLYCSTPKLIGEFMRDVKRIKNSLDRVIKATEDHRGGFNEYTFSRN